MRVRLLALVLFIVLAAAAAHAATITITVSAAQLQRVTRGFTRTNARLAAQTPPGTPYATVQDYAVARLLSVVAEDTVGFDADDRQDFLARCRAASDADRDALCVRLGQSAGCNPCPQ